MSKRKYTNDWYKLALQGAKDNDAQYKGLRKYATGFDAKNGYDLRDIDNWTASQKRKVREYAKVVHELQARSNVVYKTRSASKLEIAQEAGQHPKGFKQIKVAFIPYTPAKSDPSAKPRVTVSDRGVSVKAKYYEKVFFAFDKTRLAKRTEQELDRIVKNAESDGFKHFTIATGLHQLGQTFDGASFKNAVLMLMAKYDGRKPLPDSSGNRGDSPKSHHWKLWLEGMVGYRFTPGGTNKRLLQDIEQARRERRLERDRMRKRKGK